MTAITPDEVYDPTPEKVRFVTNGWKWAPVTELPTRDADGTLRFSDFPLFTPNKTPREILREGAFGGGASFWPFRSRKLNLVIGENGIGQWEEIPAEWLIDLDMKRYVTGEDNNGYAVHINKYNVSCEYPTEEWLAAGRCVLLLYLSMQFFENNR
jgi:hypothetical protein